MGALRWIWVGTIAVAALAAVVVVLIARGGGSGSAAPATGTSVETAIDHTSVEFGDLVTATVAVTAPRGAAVHVDAGLAPLTQIGKTRVTHVSRGSMQTVTYIAEASCLDDRCISRNGPVRISLEPASVDVAGSTQQASWPRLTVQRRVTPADAAETQPPLRSDTTPPPVTYDSSPHRLALVLDVVAALLAVAGVLVAGATVAALYRRRRRAEPLTGLARALALAREAEGRPEPDRRRALGLLARLLDARDPRLADEADELAWSSPAPTSDALSELVTHVEHEVSRS